jgi:hypothetical protein
MGVLEALRRDEQKEGAPTVLNAFKTALSVEEVTEALAPKLAQLAVEAQRVINDKRSPLVDQVTDVLRKDVREALIKQIIEALASTPDNDVVRIAEELRIKRVRGA